MVRGNIVDYLVLKCYLCDCLMNKNFQFIFSTVVVPSAIPIILQKTAYLKVFPQKLRFLLAGGR